VIRRAAAPLLAAALAFAGAASAAGPPLRVFTTTTDLKALVEAVGGTRVLVESLAPASGDPHSLEPKPAQLARFRLADVVIAIGLDHEPWLANMKPTAPVVDVSRGVALLQSETARLRSDARPHVHGFGNTHYWLDPENGRPMTKAILDGLAKVRPEDFNYFEDNRSRFLERLDAGLVRWRAAMAPYRGTRIVVIHETWPYFAERFGLKIVGAAEPVPGVPPTPSEIGELIARMRAGSVRVLVIEPYSDMALVNQIAHGSVARVVSLAPSVGAEPGTGDYIALFDYNVRRWVEVMTAR
jgi:ABC-type Zn uptake system ZnuABC Zn-binding protein ZnuA